MSGNRHQTPIEREENTYVRMWYKGGLEGEGSTPEEVQVVMCVCVVPHSHPYLKRACDLEPRTVVTREKCKHDGIECVGYYCIHRM